MTALDAMPQSYFLLDACALAPHEAKALEALDDVAWLYQHIPDESAKLAGPVLMADSPAVEDFVERLKADEARQWSLASLSSQASFSVVLKHLASLRYLRAPDGQKFYLRFADSRSLSSLWQVLSERQRARLLGPIVSWRYTSRRGLAEQFDLTAHAHLGQVDMPAGDLRLNDQQMDELLHLSWPDQLLLAVADQMSQGLAECPSWLRHANATRVCDWLRQNNETRYPVQMALAKSVLMSAEAEWSEATWLERLSIAHEQIVRTP